MWDQFSGVVNSVALNCAQVNAGAFGGAVLGTTSSTGFSDPNGGTVVPLSCPAGSVVTGLLGFLTTVYGYNNVVGDVSIVCTPITPGIRTTVGPAHGQATTSSLSCPGGTVVTGMQGAGGQLFEAVTLRCQ